MVGERWELEMRVNKSKQMTFYICILLAKDKYNEQK